MCKATTWRRRKTRQSAHSEMNPSSFPSLSTSRFRSRSCLKVCASRQQRPHRADCAVFFEFKHYKPKKTKVSTKCFCFMEKDELQRGSFPLEVFVVNCCHLNLTSRYAKPTDFKRKKLHLLTDKPGFFMYVTVSLHKF